MKLYVTHLCLCGSLCVMLYICQIRLLLILCCNYLVNESHSVETQSFKLCGKTGLNTSQAVMKEQSEVSLFIIGADIQGFREHAFGKC